MNNTCFVIWRFKPQPPRSAAPRGLDRGDVDLLHFHHRIECALCFSAADRHRLGQYAWRDLPRDAPVVLAPAAFALLSAVADNGVPVAVGLLLIVGGDLEREGFVVFERGAAVEADARDSGDDEFDCNHIAFFPGWEITGRAVDGAYRTVGKGLRVELGSFLGVFIVPEANRVLCDCMSFHFADSGLRRPGKAVVSRRIMAHLRCRPGSRRRPEPQLRLGRTVTIPCAREAEAKGRRPSRA